MSTVKVAVGMRSVEGLLGQGEMTALDFVKYASRLYVKGVELVGRYLPAQGDELRELAQVLQGAGLELVVCAGEESLKADFQGELERALALGAGAFKILSSSQSGEVYPQILEELLPKVEGTGITLLLENSASPSFGCAQLAELLEQVQSAQVLGSFNIVNSVLAGENPIISLQQLTGRLGQVVAGNLRRTKAPGGEGPEVVGSVLGLGMVPLTEILGQLQAQEYRGWISVEYSGREDVFFGLEASLKKLYELLQLLGQKGITATGETWTLS